MNKFSAIASLIAASASAFAGVSAAPQRRAEKTTAPVISLDKAPATK